MRGGLLFGISLAAIPAQAGPSLKDAAALYHRGRYDSALIVLDSCRNGPLTHRDSLALFQYSGMASVRAGRDGQAQADFGSLLSLDSLFQFPTNEEAPILSAFARAKEEFAASAFVPADASQQPSPAPSVSAPEDPSRRPSPPPSVSGAVPALAAVPPESPLSLSLSLPPAPAPARRDRPEGIGMALGAVPFGAGWISRGRYRHGLSLALLQAGGAVLSIYASSRVSALDSGPYRLRTDREAEARNWQWTQRLSLTTAVGAYLFSLFASGRD